MNFIHNSNSIFIYFLIFNYISIIVNKLFEYKMTLVMT